MPTMSEVTTGINGALRGNYVLQSGANSTVAGGAVDINYDGEYIYAVKGTLDTAQPSLYVQRAGTTGYGIATSNTGEIATLTTDATACAVLLSRGDKVYSQTTVVGGSSDFDTVLNPTNS